MFDPYNLAPPPLGVHPTTSMNFIKAHAEKTGIKIDSDHGTTTVGMHYQSGIILAADSRTTSGSYISSQSAKKIVEIGDSMLATMAGVSADGAYWLRVLRRECRLYELRHKESMSATAASKILFNICYKHRRDGLEMSILLAGPGRVKDELELYYVDSDVLRQKGKLFSIGSGSDSAYGLLDSEYEWELEDEAAHEMVQRALYYAAMKDAYTGGSVVVHLVTPKGCTKMSNTDLAELHEKYQYLLNGEEDTDSDPLPAPSQ
ncbi:proteasome subunit beta type-5-like [Drosophila bipectinata]|uniref:proteasome subunit beta type-5-like n=1 Tax=Drosophila bipectinata TaxID=42026 RepID=UPI0038B29228